MSFRKTFHDTYFNLKLVGRVEISMYKMRMLNISFSRPLFSQLSCHLSTKISKSDVAHIERLGKRFDQLWTKCIQCQKVKPVPDKCRKSL